MKKFDSQRIASYLAAMTDAGIISRKDAEAFWIDAQTSPDIDAINKRFHAMRTQYVQRNAITLSLLTDTTIAIADRLSIDPVFGEFDGKKKLKNLTDTILQWSKRVYSKADLSRLSEEYVAVSLIFDEVSQSLNKLSVPEMLFILSLINETAKNGIPNFYIDENAAPPDDATMKRFNDTADILIRADKFQMELANMAADAATEAERNAYQKAAQKFIEVLTKK